jgi:hypothetical protein
MEKPDASPVPCVPSTSSTSPIFALSAASEAVPPPPTAPTGLLTYAAKSKMHTVIVEVPHFKAFNPTAGPSTAPYELRKKRPREPVIKSPDEISDSSSDEISDFSPDDTPRKAMEVPPGLTIPRVCLETASPPHPAQNLPFSTGRYLPIVIMISTCCSHHLQDMCGPCFKTGQTQYNACTGKYNHLRTACTLYSECKKTCSKPRLKWATPIFDAMQRSMYSTRYSHFPLITVAAPSPGGYGAHLYVFS